MHRPTRVATLCTALLLGACAPADEPVEEAAERAGTTEADVEAITAVHEQEEATIEAGDVEGFLAVNAPDVIWLPPGEPPVNGQDALRAWAAGLLAEYQVEVQNYTIDGIEVVGDVAYERNSGTLVLTPAEGGEPVSERFKGIHILRRQADGSWKIALDIWNAAPAPDGQDG